MPSDLVRRAADERQDGVPGNGAVGGGTTPTKAPEEEDEEAALADAIDAAASDALRGEGFIGSRELTSQLLQAADASRAPCRSPFAELGDGEGLPQQ